MICFDSSFLTIHWEEDSKIVRAEWKDAAGGEPMKRGMWTGLEAVKQLRANRWLADTRNLGTMTPEDVKWVNDVWIPQVVAAGIRHMAFVMPKKVVVQLSVKSFMSRIDDHELANAYFENLDEARAWLRSAG